MGMIKGNLHLTPPPVIRFSGTISFPDESRSLETFKTAPASAIRMKADESAISFPGQILR